MKTVLRSDELSCPTCVGNIEKALTNLQGVQEATVHFNTGRIEVEHEADTVDEQTLIETVENTGYKAKVSAF